MKEWERDTWSADVPCGVVNPPPPRSPRPDSSKVELSFLGSGEVGETFGPGWSEREKLKR